MIRIVLAVWSDGDWRVYRQTQWVAHLRRTPEAATRPRFYFEIDEAEYVAALAGWDGSSRELALDLLERHGAREVRRD